MKSKTKKTIFHQASPIYSLLPQKKRN